MYCHTYMNKNKYFYMYIYAYINLYLQVLLYTLTSYTTHSKSGHDCRWKPAGGCPFLLMLIMWCLSTPALALMKVTCGVLSPCDKHQGCGLLFRQATSCMGKMDLNVSTSWLVLTFDFVLGSSIVQQALTWVRLPRCVRRAWSQLDFCKQTSNASALMKVQMYVDVYF